MISHLLTIVIIALLIKIIQTYLRHLFSANEILGKQIASLHNLSFYQWLVKEAENIY